MQVAFAQNLSLKQAQGQEDGSLSWTAPAQGSALTVQWHEIAWTQPSKAPHQDKIRSPENKFR